MQFLIGGKPEQGLSPLQQAFDGSTMICSPSPTMFFWILHVLQGTGNRMAPLYWCKGCLVSRSWMNYYWWIKVMRAHSFWLAWPEYIKEAYRSGKLANSDLEMAGLLFMWLVIEESLPSLKAAYISLFSDNFPMVVQVKWLTTRVSHVAIQLLRAFTSRIKANRTSPLTPFHIPGE